MKKLLLASAATMLATMATADDVKLGILLGFTGPIETMAVNMGNGAELAVKEISRLWRTGSCSSFRSTCASACPGNRPAGCW